MKSEPLARLYRPSPASFFPETDIVAMLDGDRNIVYFRQDLFDRLSSLDQSKVYNLRDKYLRFTTTEPGYSYR
jgi:hypothetical protein